MITRSSAYAYFLETVVGRSEVETLKRCDRTDPCVTLFLRHRNLVASYVVTVGKGETAIANELHGYADRSSLLVRPRSHTVL